MSSEIVVPKTKPFAADTWELRAFLSRTDDATDRLPLNFPRPKLIVGIHSVVIRGSYAGGLAIPDTKDILVLMDLDNMRRFTSEGQSSNAGQNSSFVNLSSLDTEFRDLMIDCNAPQPVVGFTFAWWHFEPGVPRYEDAEIAVSLYVQDPIPGVGAT
ncbi:MAG TPA: hypothetical protein VNG33_23575 [Polyangiaceae bacterium]|nr:hypothetical protein [Polyangiaceae bacterium]